MKNVIIKAKLLPPANEIHIGGVNLVIFTKTFTIELGPKILESIMGGYVKVSDKFKECKITRYDSTTNIMRVKGNMKSSDGEYTESLKKDGWKMNTEGAKHHGIPR